MMWDMREPHTDPLCQDPHWEKLDPEDACLGPGGCVLLREVAPLPMDGDLAQKGCTLGIQKCH